MKKYIAGFLAGVVASIGVVGVFGSVQSYTLNKYDVPVYINGVKYPTDALPILSLEANGGDNTYVPLRNFSEMLGLEVKFDKANNRIDIGSSEAVQNNNSGTSNANSNNNNKDKDKVKENNGASNNVSSNSGSGTSSMEFNSTYKLDVYTINGVQYVDCDQIDEVYFDDDYKVANDEYEFESYRESGSGELKVRFENNDKILLDGITARSIDDDDYLIELNYFVENIYPVIK